MSLICCERNVISHIGYAIGVCHRARLPDPKGGSCPATDIASIQAAIPTISVVRGPVGELAAYVQAVDYPVYMQAKFQRRLCRTLFGEAYTPSDTLCAGTTGPVPHLRKCKPVPPKIDLLVIIMTRTFVPCISTPRG